jgi:hypothetical protein
MNRGGFPHSEISGSKPVCGSPELIAAYHVLHRLLAPRHSPYALSSLTIRTRFLRPRGCPRVPGIRYALRVHVRNYRLQDIQLSKSAGAVVCAGLGAAAPRGGRGGLETPTRLPGVRLACQPSLGARLRAVALRRATSAFRRRAEVGGEYRARTGDLLVANQALSQLS